MKRNESSCLFCELATDNESIIVENEYFSSRYDSYPVSKGHALIVSKRHVLSFFDLSDEEVKGFYALIKTTREAILKMFQPSGFNIGVNDGEVAGQTIPHLHIHLFPRYKGDVENPQGGVRNIIPNLVKYPPCEQSKTG